MIAGVDQSTPPEPHVLITEDDPVMRGLLRDILSQEGFRVTVLDDWEPAEVKRLRPDVLLLDYRGDALDSGWHFLALLQADPATAAIPAIFLTADHRAMEARAGEFAALGVRSVLKPFEVGDLVAAIRGAGGGAG